MPSKRGSFNYDIDLVDISGHDIRMSVMGLREYMSVMGVERIYVSDGG